MQATGGWSTSGRAARAGLGWRWWVGAAAFACGLGAAGRAQADTLFIEAEGGGNLGHPLSNSDAKITSPFLIKDDGAASMGRYLTVASGLNSQSSPPPVEGVAKYRFNVDIAGTYRIWGRVIAPNPDSDSFWVRLRKVGETTSTLIRWNDIAPGSSWHWAQVINDGTTTPVQFALESQVAYDLEVSYRESGAKLDLMVITDDTTFNPKAPPTTAPPLPENTFDAPQVIPRKLTAGAKTGIRLYWSEVPGAKSYTVERMQNDETLTPIKNLTTHVYQETTLPPPEFSNCYKVTAIFADGSSREFPFNNFGVCQDLSYRQTFLDTSSTLTGSSPMIVDESSNSAYTKAGTPSSKNAPPAHGRIRFDFAVGGAAKLRLWFVANIPDDSHDSFWARMDEGTWVKWNNIPDGCAQLSNSDNDDKPHTFNVAAGTHRFELATRETGTVTTFQAPSLSNIFFITDNLNETTSICSD